MHPAGRQFPASIECIAASKRRSAKQAPFLQCIAEEHILSAFQQRTLLTRSCARVMRAMHECAAHSGSAATAMLSAAAAKPAAKPPTADSSPTAPADVQELLVFRQK